MDSQAEVWPQSTQNVSFSNDLVFSGDGEAKPLPHWVIKEEDLHMFPKDYNFKLNLVNCKLNLSKLPDVFLPC